MGSRAIRRAAADAVGGGAGGVNMMVPLEVEEGPMYASGPQNVSKLGDPGLREFEVSVVKKNGVRLPRV